MPSIYDPVPRDAMASLFLAPRQRLCLFSPSEPSDRFLDCEFKLIPELSRFFEDLTHLQEIHDPEL